MKAWLLRWRDGLWGYLALAAFLTAMMSGFTGERGIETLGARFVINLIISLSIGGTLDGVRVLVLDRLGLASRTWAARLAMLAAAMAFAVLAGTFVAQLIARALFPDHARFFPHRAVIYVAIPVTVAMTALSMKRERLVRHAQEAREELLRAQLEALTARTNPHFLFNSLNAVASLIGEDPDRAEAAVVRLAGLLRYALEGSKKDRVPLSEEVAHAESYLAFEQLRFGDRLSVKVEMEPEAGAVLVPPLILQPLVENAVNHGVAARSGGGRVEVRARRAGDRLAIVVEDDGPGPGASAHQGTRTSQADLQERLRLAYGERASMKVSRGALGGFSAELELPA